MKDKTLGEIKSASFLTPTAYDKPSFLAGLVVGGILTQYEKAYVENKRRAALSLGDYLWRLSKRWEQAGNDDNAVVKAASEVKFKLIDLKSASASLNVVNMETDYNRLLPDIQRALDRNAYPGARRLALRKLFPQREEQILKWDEESLAAYEIALWVVAEKYDCKPSTLKRLLSQAKKLNIEEKLRRLWLQQFNVRDPLPPTQLDRFPDYFVGRLLPWILSLKRLASPPFASPAPLAPGLPDPNLLQFRASPRRLPLNPDPLSEFIALAPHTLLAK